MLELLVAATESTDFRFDPAALAASATQTWPQARMTLPGDLADLVDLNIDITTDDDRYCQMAIHTGGIAIGMDTPDHETAARVLAWLAATAPLPPDGSVVVVDWTDDFYPLLPGVTYEQLMQDATTNR